MRHYSIAIKASRFFQTRFKTILLQSAAKAIPGPFAFARSGQYCGWEAILQQ
jgi:hypothetical protein